jgi:phage gp36-like protein
MGDYTSETIIMSLMPQLPQTGSSGYAVMSALVAQAITDAEAEINGYLARRYNLPFSTVPVQVRALANNLAQYYTYLNAYSADNINRNNWSEGQSTRYEIQLKKLEAIADGSMALTLTNGSLVLQASATSLVMSANKDYQPIFDLDTSTAWTLDSDRKDDISNGRG